MPGTPHSRVTVIGAAPPGFGDSGPVLRLSAPKFAPKIKDWDTCEEDLWVRDLGVPELVTGYERTADLRAAGYLPPGSTAKFWVTGYTHIGYKAGRPVVRLQCRGWVATKVTHWDGRRTMSGDFSALRFGGFSYATSTQFLATTPGLNITALSAPAVTFGFTSGVAVATYITTWPNTVTSAVPGWVYTGREILRLWSGGAPCMVVDTFTRVMSADGSNA